MYSAFEDLHASRHNYSVSCWPFSARAPPLLYPASSFKEVLLQSVEQTEIVKYRLTCGGQKTAMQSARLGY